MLTPRPDGPRHARGGRVREQLDELARLSRLSDRLGAVADGAWTAWDRSRREGWAIGEQGCRSGAEYDAQWRRLEASWRRTEALDAARLRALDAYLEVHNQARAVREAVAGGEP